MKKTGRMLKPILYHVTPLGLIGQDNLDKLLLYMVKISKNCLIWTGKEFIFEEVKYVDKVTRAKHGK